MPDNKTFGVTKLSIFDYFTGLAFWDPHHSWHKKLNRLDEVLFTKMVDNKLYVLTSASPPSFVRAVFKALDSPEQVIDKLIQMWRLEE